MSRYEKATVWAINLSVIGAVLVLSFFVVVSKVNAATTISSWPDDCYFNEASALAGCLSVDSPYYNPPADTTHRLEVHIQTAVFGACVQHNGPSNCTAGSYCPMDQFENDVSGCGSGLVVKFCLEDTDGGDDSCTGYYDLEEPDPAQNPTTTVVLPLGSYGTSTPDLKVYTDVLLADHPSEDPDFEIKVEYYSDASAAWFEYDTYEYDWSDYGFYYNGGSGLAYALGSIPELILPGSFVGYDTWRASARSDFGEGFGSWSSTSSFTTGILPYGGGGGSSWGDGDGGYDDWLGFFDDSSTANPPPDCRIFSFTWDSGTDGDGMECVWQWTVWLVIPPENSFGNYIQKPLRTIADRWPFHYLTTVFEGIMAGWTKDVDCPLPTLGATSFLNSSVPGMDTCEWFEGVEAKIEGNPTVENIIEIIIWLSLAFGAVLLGKRFLTS